jgi:glycosyltransferase involved in cell wall biosynthesis
MKIGLYCGMANNMYVFAHALSSQGVDVCFIRDRSDHYPMSQPVWEDIPFPMAYDEVPRAHFWPWSRWTQVENELKWTAPPWLYDPSQDPGNNSEMEWSVRPQGAIDTLFLKRYSRVAHRPRVLEKMKSCDALIIGGVEGTILANASGRPYIIFPPGGDLMIAAGLLQPKLYHVRERLIHTMERRQLVIAYANAICIGAHEPTAFANDFFGAEHFFRAHKSCFVAIPIPTRKRASNSNRRQALEQLLAELGFAIPSARLVGFVPSRVDFGWKGHDRLLDAIARLEVEGKASDIHVFFSGWGNDYDKARAFVSKHRLEKRITFLNCALSKPLLYRFYLSADFVIDQFIVGMTGTSALEAMSCGAPVITWVNDSVERPWGNPPVLQARTADEILVVLRNVAAGRVDLEQTGFALQQWLDRLHNPATVTRTLLDIFANA